MRTHGIEQLGAGSLVLAVEFEPAVLGAPHGLALGLPRHRVAFGIERLECIEALELEGLRVRQADAYAITEGIERERVKRMVVVGHGPDFTRAGDSFCAVDHISAQPGWNRPAGARQGEKAVTDQRGPRSQPAVPTPARRWARPPDRRRHC